MSTKSEVAVYLSGKELLVPADIEYFTQGERARKGVKALGACWLVALIFIPVPALHFVVCPLAIALGPLAGIFVYAKVKKLPKSVKGFLTCPHCGKTANFQFIDARPPLFDACEACKTGYEVLWPPRS